MKENELKESGTIGEILEQINTLTNRVSVLEKAIAKVGFQGSATRHPSNLSVKPAYSQAEDVKQEGESWLESKLGEIGLGLLGNVVLLFCIIFLMTYTQNLGYRLWPSIIGFASLSAILIFSNFNRNSFPVLTKMLSVSSFLLAYYILLRLHFFVEDPIIGSPGLVVGLLFIPIGFLLYYAVKNKLELVATLAILLIVISALFLNLVHPTLILFVVAAVVSLYLLRQFSWQNMFIISIFVVYICHAIWMWGNPIMGGDGKLLATHHFNIIYLFIYGSIFSSTLILKYKNPIVANLFIAITLINAFCFSLIILANILAFYESDYMLIFILISVYCLVFSALIKLKTSILFVPDFYACFGFMAISVAVYGYFGFPDTYQLLALQSLLVASMALWFRSRIIVVANTFLFVSILIAYLFIEESQSSINFTFAIVALVSARLLNWKKERLTLKTEFFRNIYLLLALGMLLYALHGSMPDKYISLSWIASAGLFFLLSVLLKNVKYRWLGIVAILATIIYLLVVDLAKMDIGYRIVVFLFLAVLSISISVYYTKRAKKKNNTIST
ncbi:MAG: hypothetical protein K9H64_13610 [Bacteroidales bacterium]|nr:hypothetical protein [Bacteroidales bacterium]MCF8457050.1 hypothetical protein [Bacteroidales bacterium]